MLKRYLYGLIIATPLLFLFFFSVFFSFEGWNNYKNDNDIEKKLQNIKLLQSLEHSFFNELVCVSTLKPNEVQNVCRKMHKTTDRFLSEIKADTFDSQLYALKNNIEQMRTKMSHSGHTAINLMVKGEIEKNIHNYIQRYISVVERSFTNPSDRNSLELYASLNNVSYASESEKAFIAYYLALKKPIIPEHLIFWDKIIALQKFSFLNNEKYRIYSDALSKIWESDSVQQLLRQIEDIRFDLMTHASTGDYRNELIEWITLSNQKHKVLMYLEDTVIDSILSKIGERIEETIVQVAFASLLSILSLISLYLLLHNLFKERKEAERFEELFNKIKRLQEEETYERSNFSDKKTAYNFIESSFEKIHEDKQKLEVENRSKNTLFSTMFYKMYKPVDTIIGYSALMKEMPLTTEQKDFILHIDASARRLDKIMRRSPEHLASGRVMDFEIKKRAFDIIRETESTVEIFATPAAQKDIHLSLYTDPSLTYKVLGDNIRIYEVLNNLIDKALKTTHTYGNVDIFLEKVHEDEKDVVIRFTVKNASMGYSAKELEEINACLNHEHNESTFGDIREQMLQISNAILVQMDSKLDIESEEGVSLSYSFSLRLSKSTSTNSSVPVHFEGMKIGIALPSLNIHRQQEKNMEAYLKALGVSYRIYDYDSLFNASQPVSLPDLMLVYHHYARLEGEIDTFMNLDCNIVLITTPTLRSRIDLDKYQFSSIVYDPVTYHKIIRILAESKLGHTTCTKDKKRDREEKEGKEESIEFQGLHVLIAEDNEINQKLWKEKLGTFGIDVTIVSNGKEAFDKRRENDFDMIFMDIDMPLMDGYEATNKILYFERINQLHHVPIIALVSTTDNREKYLKLGMDDIFIKSSSDENLKELLQKYGIEMAIKRSETEEDELIAKVLSGGFFKE